MKRTSAILITLIVCLAAGYRIYHSWMRSTDSTTREAIAQQILNRYDNAKPCEDRFVCDMFSLFTTENKDYITSYHRALLEQFDIDLRVFISTHDNPSTLFNEIQVGERSQTRKGMLLLINPQKNLVRLEVSAGLDAVYTDGFVKYLQERQMLPFFNANQVAVGVVATTEMIVDRAKKAQKGEEFIPPSQLTDTLGIGAGAQSDANIGKGYTAPTASTPSPTNTTQGLTPEQVVAAYHEALSQGNGSPDLAIYSANTKAMRKSWVVTRAQMKNELNAYEDCTIDKTLTSNGIGVVRYQWEDRECAPYFFIYEDDGWKLDFSTMMQRVQFNVSNEWHFKRGIASDYDKFFADWRLDNNGYPQGIQKLRWGLHFQTYNDGLTRVEYVVPDSAAQAMNFAEGDIILKWGAMEKPSYKDMADALWEVEDGASIPVTIQREDETYQITVTAPTKE